MFDERGLFLIVTPAGGKWWRLRYKFDNKESGADKELETVGAIERAEI